MTSPARLVIVAATALCLSAAAAFAQDGGMWTQVDPKFRIAAGEKASYTVDGSHVAFKAGRALFEPQETIVVRTALSEIHINRRALVYVRADKGIERVLVLIGNATVHAGRHSSSIRAGEEAVISDHEPTYNDLVADEIGRRRVRVTTIDGKTIVLTEFSLVHAIEREPLLNALIHTDSRESKVIKEKLIKMAAVLTLVTSRHGPYSTSAR